MAGPNYWGEGVKVHTCSTAQNGRAKRVLNMNTGRKGRELGEINPLSNNTLTKPLISVEDTLLCCRGGVLPTTMQRELILTLCSFAEQRGLKMASRRNDHSLTYVKEATRLVRGSHGAVGRDGHRGCVHRGQVLARCPAGWPVRQGWWGQADLRRRPPDSSNNSTFEQDGKHFFLGFFFLKDWPVCKCSCRNAPSLWKFPPPLHKLVSRISRSHKGRLWLAACLVHVTNPWIPNSMPPRTLMQVATSLAETYFPAASVHFVFRGILGIRNVPPRREFATTQTFWDLTCCWSFLRDCCIVFRPWMKWCRLGNECWCCCGCYWCCCRRFLAIGCAGVVAWEILLLLFLMLLRVLLLSNPLLLLASCFRALCGRFARDGTAFS